MFHKILHLRPDHINLARLAKLNRESHLKLLSKQPYLMSKQFDNKIAYRMSGESPEDVISAGGFIEKGNLCVSNTETGLNSGSVCFSLLPQICTIFYKQALEKSKHNTAFIYAMPLNGTFVIPGKEWSEVISPGAFPLPNSWFVRKVENISLEGQVTLGPIRIHGHEHHHVEAGEHFDLYLKNKLIRPDESYAGEDMTYFDIEKFHTSYTKQHLQEVEEHYNTVAKLRYKR